MPLWPPQNTAPQMMTAPQLLLAWRAGFTRRWHANADLCHLVDPVCGHSGRVAILCMGLFPDDPDLVHAAIIHDLGEMNVGDVTAPAKHAAPQMAASLAAIESGKRAAMGLPTVRPFKELKFCDSLDAYLFMLHHKPTLESRDDWRAHLAQIYARSEELCIPETVAALIRLTREAAR